MAKPNTFDIPNLYYFESKNMYTGSRKSFNYKVVPDGELKVCTWHGFINSELANIEHEAAFPMTEEGFQEMLAWLTEMYAE